MRKKVKTITQEIHDWGIICVDVPLLTSLLQYCCGDSPKKEHIDSIIKNILLEAEDGDVLSMSNYPVIIEPYTA